MKVPYLDLAAHHQPLREEFRRAIDQVIDCGAFAGGPFVEQFENEFAEFCGAKHASGVGNGTDALWLALTALGVGLGDEVITVPNTFFATAEAISLTGATPVFVDVLEDTYNMDPGLLTAALTPRTKAIIPVHLFGQPADMDPILDFASRNGIVVVEDAAQAHGAEYRGRRVGTLGIAGCFSFYPGKNLGAFGEGGAVVTQDGDLNRKIQMLRDHGQAKKYHHQMIGWNCRMDGIQAAVLRIKLTQLDHNNELRRAHASRYIARLKDLDEIALPCTAPGARHVWHIFAIRLRERNEVMRLFTERGIGCGIHYPVTVHLQEAYRHLGYHRGSFPVAERYAQEFLSLPMFPELTNGQLDYVVDSLRQIMVDRLSLNPMRGNAIVA